MSNFFFICLTRPILLGARLIFSARSLARLYNSVEESSYLITRFVIPHTNGTRWAHTVDVVVVGIMKIEGFTAKFLVFFVK